MSAADAWTVADPCVCPTCGRESCEDHGAAAPDLGGFVPAADVMREPAPAIVVDGLAWAGTVTVLVGAPNSGKTFVTTALAAAASQGRAWLGRHVAAGSTAYLLFEGDDLGRRLRAIVEDSGDPLDHVYVLRGLPPLSPRIERDGAEHPSLGEVQAGDALAALAAHLRDTGRPPIRLLMIDTVRASLIGNEDASDVAAAYLRAVRRLLARCPGAAAILSHHTGWLDGEAPKKRERGSSAWRGNADATVVLDVDDDTDPKAVQLTLRTLKARDAERAEPLHFVRREVALPEQDAYGRPRTSCVVRADPRSRAEQAAAETAAARDAEDAVDRQVLRALHRHPDVATSQNAIRVAAGCRRDDVIASLLRLADAGYVLPPRRQRHPYTLTPEGLSYASQL